MSAKPLALMILDGNGMICWYGDLDQAEKLAERAEKWNQGDRGVPPFRVVPVGEIPAWQPIATALKDGSAIRVGKAGGVTGEVRWDGRAWASATWSECAFLAPEFWQPLSAAPEVES